MTTIAYDPVSMTLAADRQVTLGNTSFPLSQAKIMAVRLAHRRLLVGFAGIPADCVSLLEHYLHSPRTLGLLPMRPAPLPDDHGSLLVVEFMPERRVRAVYVSRHGTETDITATPWASGAGCDYAIGALHAGANAERAVEIATRLDIYTGYGIQVEDLNRWMDAPAEDFVSFGPTRSDDFGQELPARPALTFLTTPPELIRKQDELLRRALSGRSDNPPIAKRAICPNPSVLTQSAASLSKDEE